MAVGEREGRGDGGRHPLARRGAARRGGGAGGGGGSGGPRLSPARAATTGTYDDGTGAIPGGLAGDVERVIVVGAGWAGLTLANALRNAGVDHVVLEARDRI